MAKSHSSVQPYEASGKQVLLVAYLFPPIGGGGVQRAVKMAKYLGEFGWKVHVLTVEPSYHVSLDYSLLEQLPDTVMIHRCKEGGFGRPPVAAAAAGAPSGTGTEAGTGAATGGQPLGAGAPGSARAGGGGAVSRLKSAVFPLLKRMKRYVLVPDDQILWVPAAARQALNIVREYGIEAVVSTSGPYSNHLVGLYLKRKTGLPWIADFRDPWTQNMHRTGIRWREWLEERLERMVLRESDCLLTVTQTFADNFKAKFAEELRRVEVIHNGFDRADYEELNRTVGSRLDGPNDSQSSGRHAGDSGTSSGCTFIYTGIFYKERNPRLFLKAVRELIDEGTLPEQAIKLQFAGVFDYPGYSENIDCVRELKLEPVVELMGHLPHKKALAAMKNADILMLVGDTAPDSGAYIPGKLYEYMAIGHPILALSMPGESNRIIASFGLGEVADPSSLEQIKEAVRKLYRQWQASAASEGEPDGDELDAGDLGAGESSTGDPNAGEPNVGDPASVPPSGEQPEDASRGKRSTLIYERREQARLLAVLLDELVEHSGQPEDVRDAKGTPGQYLV